MFDWGGIVKIDVTSPIPTSGHRSATAWEGLREVLAGGPIRNFTIRRVRITDRGIGVVERHVARFGPDRANEIMLPLALEEILDHPDAQTYLRS